MPKRPWWSDEDVDDYARFLGDVPEESRRRFRALMATVTEVLGETDLDALLAKLVRHAIDSTGAARGVLLLRSPEGLAVRVALDRHGRDLGTAPDISHTIPGRVVDSGEPVIARVSEDQGVLELSTSTHGLRLRQLMCAPLRARGNVLGAIYVDSTAGGRPHTRSDLALFHAQAGLMGLALENHRLFREAFEARDVRRQLEVAREIQERLFPRSPATFGNLRLAGVSVISAQVGGDYFDYLPLDGDRVGLGIGDVAGSGIATALIMSDLRGHLRSLLQTSSSLDGVAASLNTTLRQELAEDMFVALFAAVHDPGPGELRYLNAGHSAPLLWRAKSASFDELGPTAPALALFDDPGQRPCPAVPVASGDCLVCYTDGVIDRPAPDGERYGRARLVAIAAGALRENAAAEDVAEAIRADAEVHAAGRAPRDDLTVMVARFG